MLVLIALTDARHYPLTVGAILSPAPYLTGHACRFQIMDRHAKVGDETKDRRFLVEEHIATPIMLGVPHRVFGAAERTFRPDPSADVPDPAGRSPGADRHGARRMRDLVRDRLADRGAHYALSGIEGA